MFEKIKVKLKKLLILKKKSYKQKLIDNGSLKVGNSCDISQMNIVLIGNGKIIIGDNCCIRGTIILYRNESIVSIGDNVYIGPGTLIECVEQINIKNDVLISLNCNIIDTNSHSLFSLERINDTIDWQKGLEYKDWSHVLSKSITIESNSWIGLRCIILKGVRIGKGSIVGAGSVVTKNVDDYCLFAGNPAKFIKNVK